jgi:hypothetical protein
MRAVVGCQAAVGGLVSGAVVSAPGGIVEKGVEGGI